MKIALTSATGKLGSAVLNAILDNNLTEPENLVVCVSLPPFFITTNATITRNSREQATRKHNNY